MLKPLLGVGWDVGGWIGKAQAVAVVTSSESGVVWRGQPRRFSLRSFGSADWTLLDLIRQAWPDARDNTLDSLRMILAVDAPFGFPSRFVDFLLTGKAPEFNVKDDEILNPLAYRDCDRHIFTTFGKKPLSASFDKLGNNATVAMHHARRLARSHNGRVLPFDTADPQAHTIIEVYPALAKKPNDACCYPPFQSLLPKDTVWGSDECDACICALMALAFGEDFSERALPTMVGPNLQQLESAKHEGWIYYPSFTRSWVAR